jgi:alpha-L-arabinofuranosidase
MRIVLKPRAAVALCLSLLLLCAVALIKSRRTEKSVGDGIQPTHLIARWNFDEGTGKTTGDSSPGGAGREENIAALQGNAGWSPGIVGPNSLNVTGEGGTFASLSRPVVDTSRSFTVSACVRLRRVDGFQTFVSIDGERVSGFYLQLRQDTGMFAFAILPQDDPGDNRPALAGASEAPETDRWYHLTGVHDANAHTLSLYIDGVLAETVPHTTPWRATGSTIMGRGKYGGNPVDFVDGQIDDVRFYDTALSASDVAALARKALPHAVPKADGSRLPATLQIDAARATRPVSPLHYGLMTEEINYSYDGGLYAEFLQNRAFKDHPETPVHWSLVQDGGGTGSIALNRSEPANEALTTALKLTVSAVSPTQRVGIANDGFWGIPVRPKTTYRATFLAKAESDFRGPLTVSLESTSGERVHAKATINRISNRWRRYSVTLTTPDNITPTADNLFVIAANTPGTVSFAMVSLFPPTYRGRPNGNRSDLMDKMAALKPTFLRFPGGNYLEGDTIADRFDWKKTLGDITTRPGHPGPWRYRSSDGMGLLEFLLWCEDLKMEPVLGVYAGYSLKQEYIPAGPKLQPYVQDALDEIEYIIGDRTTKWGAIRARDGHPEPFPLTYVEIGNEDWFDRSGSYEGRFAQFYDAIKAKYPKLQIVASTKVRSRTPDVIDEHYYKSPRAFAGDVRHYDDYDRNGPKIMVGEWASNEGKPTPNLNSALGDAAWMTGMERNADIVVMQCYAPLFVNVNPGGSQWGTNLIGYDAMSSYGSPSFYVQQMFSNHRGDRILSATLTGGTQLFQSVTRDSETGTVYIKLVNMSGAAQTVHISLAGVSAVSPTGTAVVLSGANPKDTNTLHDPTKIVPVTSTVDKLGKSFDYALAPYSVSVLKVQTQ